MLSIISKMCSLGRRSILSISEDVKMCCKICSFEIGAMEKIGHDEMTWVLNQHCCPFASIVAERVSSDIASDSLPPVLPTQLVKLRGLEFCWCCPQEK
jgi:hypothetical protein